LLASLLDVHISAFPEAMRRIALFVVRVAERVAWHLAVYEYDIARQHLPISMASRPLPATLAWTGSLFSVRNATVWLTALSSVTNPRIWESANRPVILDLSAAIELH
jgi:hypothetical protein